MNYVIEKMKQVICRTKISFIKRFFFFGFIWWKNWSNAYRKLYDSDYGTAALERNLSLTEVQEKLATLTWSLDGSKELWDVCGDPKRVQHMLDEIEKGNKQPEGALDCDDFSIWAVHVIDKNFYPRIFCFLWVDKETCAIRGHAMCLLRQKDGRIFHIGNWGTSKPFSNLREACLDILERTDAGESVGWSILYKDLSVLEWGLELPSGSVT